MEQLEVPSATMSLYLKELSAAGLVTQERAGRNVIYRAAYENMDSVVAFLTKNCCKGLARNKKPETADTCGR
jgi:ArsR family transcriptional regulator